MRCNGFRFNGMPTNRDKKTRYISRALTAKVLRTYPGSLFHGLKIAGAARKKRRRILQKINWRELHAKKWQDTQIAQAQRCASRGDAAKTKAHWQLCASSLHRNASSRKVPSVLCVLWHEERAGERPQGLWANLRHFEFQEQHQQAQSRPFMFRASACAEHKELQRWQNAWICIKRASYVSGFVCVCVP